MHNDWGEASEEFDKIEKFITGKNLSEANEAQTRFDVIDRMIKDVLGWQHGQIKVEKDVKGINGRLDYIYTSGDYTIIIEAKKIGAAFPNPTVRKKARLSGALIGKGEIAEAIKQATDYAKELHADIVIVTNGSCWCFFNAKIADKDSYADLLFPFQATHDAETLFNVFATISIESNSLLEISNAGPQAPENRLISQVNDSDARIDRNNIADFIGPALDAALNSDALLKNKDALEYCFVPTEARQKFDTTLGVHLADYKPKNIYGAKRIKTGQEHGQLQNILETGKDVPSPPITLVLGPVGAGKSTYLKHFEKIAGEKTLKEKQAHWIYIDLEEMGKMGNPRKFIYSRLKDYLEKDHIGNSTDYHNLIEPAYHERILALSRGHFAVIARDKEAFDKAIFNLINKDYEEVEPYIDYVYNYLAREKLCIIVLDNIDLYEDELLETTVFSEGLALSKRLGCHVMVSLRDTTYVKHKNDSNFDAYEFKKLWLDPPPLKTVISRRLTYAANVLNGKSARIPMDSGAFFTVPDLSVFFDIVQRSILNAEAGNLIISLADTNIRRGLLLILNFLISGHIHADKAISIVIDGRYPYKRFPFQEIFKGAVLGQWKYYKEQRAECINLFDSRISSKKLRLLRFFIIKYLAEMAKDPYHIEVNVSEVLETFAGIGASENQILSTLNFFLKNGLIKNTTAEVIGKESSIIITRSGAYYSRSLSKNMTYVEACMLDTAIDDETSWAELSELTIEIDNERNISRRMELRNSRMKKFLSYLNSLEKYSLADSDVEDFISGIEEVNNAVMEEMQSAILSSNRLYPKT
ncbi:MAG: hypothetical protein Q8916_08235 [Bacteroidota bacterium]|nr:hypothetical protein [Bacteroidota bacterium]